MSEVSTRACATSERFTLEIGSTILGSRRCCRDELVAHVQSIPHGCLTESDSAAGPDEEGLA